MANVFVNFYITFRAHVAGREAHFPALARDLFQHGLRITCASAVDDNTRTARGKLQCHAFAAAPGYDNDFNFPNCSCDPLR